MAPRLFLIDGNSLVYRAFFALPDSIATSKGEPTNAIFGFASMLVKILTEHGTAPTLVVWDGGWSGREQVYTEYKAERRSRPDLLKEQWPQMEPLVEAFGYANVRVEGFEADDVIATLATQAKEKRIDVTIVTGDRDAFQLIEPGVEVMATSRGITDTKTYDREAVIERYGITPEQIPDFYGLKGDSSDNIPGVPGIGDKTASQLLNEYGDLETVLASVDKISGAKRKQNLTEHADDARVSKELATAIRDVPGVDVDLEGTAAQEPDRSQLREVFRRWELRDPLRRLEEFFGEDGAAPERPTETTIHADVEQIDLAALPAWLERLGGRPVALAVNAEPLRFAVYGGESAAAGAAASLAKLRIALGDHPIVAHDWKSTHLQEPDTLVHDTMLAA
ncbi:MAG: polymerase, partial [Acidimicrobiaceae bacterium]